MYKYRIIMPDGRATRQADWLSTPSAMLIAELRHRHMNGARRLPQYSDSQRRVEEVRAMLPIGPPKL